MAKVAAETQAPEVKPQVAEKKAFNWQYERDKDREMVRGKFIFHECPGGVMSFNFKKWKGDEVQRYDLVDGEIYSLPLGVAKHLNQNCWYPVHQYYETEAGGHKMKVGQKVRRCSFQSLEFIDVDDLTPVGTPGLTTVEFVKG